MWRPWLGWVVYLLGSATLGVAWYFALIYTTIVGEGLGGGIPLRETALFAGQLALSSVIISILLRRAFREADLGKAAVYGLGIVLLGMLLVILILDLTGTLTGSPFGSLLQMFPVIVTLFLVFSPQALLYGLFHGILLWYVHRLAFGPPPTESEVETSTMSQ